jgi:hypothetical protein
LYATIKFVCVSVCVNIQLGCSAWILSSAGVDYGCNRFCLQEEYYLLRHPNCFCRLWMESFLSVRVRKFYVSAHE